MVLDLCLLFVSFSVPTVDNLSRTEGHPYINLISSTYVGRVLPEQELEVLTLGSYSLRQLRPVWVPLCRPT